MVDATRLLAGPYFGSGEMEGFENATGAGQDIAVRAGNAEHPTLSSDPLAGRRQDAEMGEHVPDALAAHLQGLQGNGAAAAHLRADGGQSSADGRRSRRSQTGRASWRERGCQYVSISVGAVSLKK